MAFSLMRWIVLLFGGESDPDAVKKRTLKRMAGLLASNKYGKFYRMKTGEVDPGLAQFFLNIYKTVSPARTFMQNAAQSARLKELTVEHFLNQKQRDAFTGFSPDVIAERAQTTPHKELAQQIEAEFAELNSGFDDQQINLIENCYNLILLFIHFVNFDYTFLLKKFDNRFYEYSYNQQPRFLPVRGDLVVNLLKDFLEAADGIDLNKDWDTAMKVLRNYKGDMDVLNLKHWRSLLVQLRDIKHSGILEMIVRIIEKDPQWVSMPSLSNRQIVAAYLETIRLEIFENFDRVINAKRNALINEFAKAIFGDDADMNQLKFYTEWSGDIYIKKNFEGFVYARGLNYVYAFLTEGQTEIQGLFDLLLVRGQWASASLSFPLSEAIRMIMTFPERIRALDDSLSEEGVYGARLKASLMKLDRDKKQAKYIMSTLDTLNGEAEILIVDTHMNLSIMEKGFKEVLNDYRINSSVLILNWDELDSCSVPPLEGRIAALQDKLSKITQLLQLFVKPAGMDR
jgi:hypothetical protein